MKKCSGSSVYYLQDHNNGHRGEVELTPEEYEALQLALGAMGRVGKAGGVWFHLEPSELLETGSVDHFMRLRDGCHPETGEYAHWDGEYRKALASISKAEIKRMESRTSNVGG